MKLTRWLIVAASAVGILAAQEEDAPDTPGKGVARLSLISGDVSVRRGDTGDWVAAAANGPLVVGDHVMSGPGSRAEIQLDWANLLRLSSDSEVRLPELEQDRYQVQLARGTATFSVVRDNNAQVDINTPSVSIRPLKRGMYRIEVRDDGAGNPITEIVVRSGEAEIYSPRGTQRLRSGRTMLVRGDYNDPEFQTAGDRPDDDWDRWNVRRDKELLRSLSYNYVPQGTYGAEDLDDYGSWEYAAPYGYVWSPRVAAGWAPYQLGRWSWLDYYGWNWVSYDPWGWAPYHYGRWFYHANRWCWWPGARGVRTFWRPALVAWVGWGGGGLGVSVGFGGGWGRVGWVPLAPYEPFRPWYGSRWYGGRNIHNTTIVNNINVTNIYRNSRVNNGLTVVQAQNFGRGNMQRLRMDPNDLSRASSVRGPLPMVPDRAATRMSDREARVDQVQRGAGNQRFISRSQPAPVQRVSFDDQRRGMEQVARRVFGDGDRQQQPTVAGNPSGNPSSQGGARRIGEQGNGWRRVGDPQQGQQQQPSPAANGGRDAIGRGQQQRNGWQRFGEPRESGFNAPAGRQDRQEFRQESPMTPNRENMRGVERSGGRSNDGWNRFGSVQPDAPINRGMDRSRVPERVDRGMDRNQDRPTFENRQPDRQDRSERSFGFGGFGGGGRSRGVVEARPQYQPPPQQPRMESPRMENHRGFGGGSAPRMESPRNMGGGGGGSMMRGAPSGGGGGPRGGDGGGGRGGGGNGGSGGRGGGRR